MARDTDAIEKEIQQAREALAGALDELSDRANTPTLTVLSTDRSGPNRYARHGKYAV